MEQLDFNEDSSIKSADAQRFEPNDETFIQQSSLMKFEEESKNNERKYSEASSEFSRKDSEIYQDTLISFSESTVSAKYS